MCPLARGFVYSRSYLFRRAAARRKTGSTRATQTRTCDGYLPEIMNPFSRLFPTQIFKSSDSARPESSPIDGSRTVVSRRKRLASPEIPKRRSVVAKSPDPASGRFHRANDEKRARAAVAKKPSFSNTERAQRGKTARLTFAEKRYDDPVGKVVTTWRC